MAEDIEIQKVNGKSLDIEAMDKEKLKTVFPQCFTEGKLDIDKLLSLCGEYIDNDFEKYKFEWKGKSECYRIASQRSTGTLRPTPDESVDFESTNNLYIEGDNLEVLKLLQASYYRKVKMIYIDPPYNTGHDFVYEDDFKDPIAKYKEVTSQTTKSNPETMGRYHTNWLNMMYPRLRLAANLLRDDGVIFISIDDNEVTNLKKLCDEVFGEENRLACFIWKRRQMVDSRSKTGVSEDHEYLLCYSKTVGTRIRGQETDMGKYSNPDNDPKGDWMSADMTGLATADQRPNLHYDLVDPRTKITYACPPTGWRYEKKRMDELISNGEVIFPTKKEGRPRRKKYVKDLQNEYTGLSTLLSTVYNTQATRELRALFDDKDWFDFPKPIDFLKLVVEQGTSKDGSDIILDFFSGSGTTAHAVMQLNAEDGGNRRFIMVQLPEQTDEKSEAFKAGYKNICEIGKERIRRAGAKIKEQNANVDVGFKVLKLDTSNLVKWDSAPTEETGLFTRLNAMEKSLKTDRSELDVVYEVMLKLGIPLTYAVKELNINNRKVYSVGEDSLILVCIDGRNGGITPEDVTAMCEYTPAKIVAAEEAFKDDVALSNAYYISKDNGIEIELL